VPPRLSASALKILFNCQNTNSYHTDVGIALNCWDSVVKNLYDQLGNKPGLRDLHALRSLRG